jgi:hypothetical protein
MKLRRNVGDFARAIGRQIVRGTRYPFKEAKKFWGAAIGLVAAIILIAGLVLAGTAWWQSNNPAPGLFLQDRGSGPPRPIEALNPNIPQTFQASLSPSFIRLIFVLDEFDPVGGKLQGRVGGIINPDLYHSEYPFSKSIPAKIPLTLYSLFSGTHLNVPLTSSLDGDQGDLEQSTPVELEAWGEQRRFPNDSYAVTDLYNIGGGNGWASVTLVTGSRLSQYRVRASVSYAYVNVLIERAPATRLWVYTIVTSPIVFLGALIWSGIFSRQSAVASAIEVAVGLVALLPLRQVLVPASLTDLTTVDLMLGIEFLLFVAWLAAAITLLNPDKK